MNIFYHFHLPNACTDSKLLKPLILWDTPPPPFLTKTRDTLYIYDRSRQLMHDIVNHRSDASRLEHSPPMMKIIWMFSSRVLWMTCPTEGKSWRNKSQKFHTWISRFISKSCDTILIFFSINETKFSMYGIQVVIIENV